MSETGIIEIDVGLQAKTKTEIDEYLEKVDKIKEGLGEARATDEGEEGPTLEGAEQGGNKILSALKNPQRFFESMLGKLVPSSPAILGLVGLIIASPIFFIEFMKKLSVKGGPFNRDFRRFIAEEVDVGLDRELQKRKELGLDQVIISQARGWVPNNPETTYNSLFAVNASRIARIGLDDRAAGVRAT